MSNESKVQYETADKSIQNEARARVKAIAEKRNAAHREELKRKGAQLESEADQAQTDEEEVTATD